MDGANCREGGKKEEVEGNQHHVWLCYCKDKHIAGRLFYLNLHRPSWRQHSKRLSHGGITWEKSNRISERIVYVTFIRWIWFFRVLASIFLFGHWHVYSIYCYFVLTLFFVTKKRRRGPSITQQKKSSVHGKMRGAEQILSLMGTKTISKKFHSSLRRPFKSR